MCSTLSLMLKKHFSAEESTMLLAYFMSLTRNASSNITLSSASSRMNITPDKARDLLIRCNKLGILLINYGIRCPSCNALVKRIKSIDELPEDQLYCYSCDEVFNIDMYEAEVLFSLESDYFFNDGQRQDNASAEIVAQLDTVRAFVEGGCGINSMLYDPTDEQYTLLEEMLVDIYRKRSTKTKTGKTLEDLTEELFSLVRCFRAAKVRTETNEIDCHVRNIFPFIKETYGEVIIIECKNEAKVPSITYFNKISDIISTYNGAASKPVKLGIIVSKKSPPKTYRKAANTRYIRDGVIITNIEAEEIKVLIANKQNLLETIQRKICEVRANTNTHLIASGLYES